MNVLSANEHENQSTRKVPTETMTDVLTSAKAKMLLTSKHYLKVALTKMESSSRPHQPTVRSNAHQTTRSCLK